MDEEFKLCWKNFQDNIASGFQNLYDRGEMVDVTLACDGKLLQAHKIVLAICSPYFQEIFITNPCKHPIIILKDVTFNIMCELLEFMYQGVVNVKHTELQAFMKIGQLLQIKGLATNSASPNSSSTSDKSASQSNTNIENENNQETTTYNTKSTSGNNEDNTENSNNGKLPSNNESNMSRRSRSPGGIITTSSSAGSHKNSAEHHGYHHLASSVLKRHMDYNSDTLSIYSRSKLRRSNVSTDHNSDHTETPNDSGTEHMNDDFFLPHISMVESKYDFNKIKRESSELHLSSSSASASASLRNSFPPAAFGFDFYKSSSSSNLPPVGQEQYPNELHMLNDYSKTFGNHMDIPPNGSNMVMLSSTSLLHGNCVFNRNNTVATQQGMKTYWLCKSYRISMCRARCITHQGRIISATGVHNHPPHMRTNGSAGPSVPTGSSGSAGGGTGSTSSAGGTGGNSGSSNANTNSGGNTATNTAPSSGSSGIVGGTATCSENQQNPPQTSSGIPTSNLPNSNSSMYNLRFLQNNNPNINSFQQNLPLHNQHGHHHTSTPPSLPVTHLNPGIGTHFPHTMPNLLIEPHIANNQLNLLQSSSLPLGGLAPPPPPTSGVIQNMMQNTLTQLPPPPPPPSSNASIFDMTSVMHSSPAHNHREHGEKTSLHLVKDNVMNDNHMSSVHNPTLSSPTDLNTNAMNAASAANEAMNRAENEYDKDLSHRDGRVVAHHQAQVIESVTISPGGGGHSFKMENM